MSSYRGHFLTGSAMVQNIRVELQSQGVTQQGEEVLVETEYCEVCVVCGDKASG